MMKYSIVYIVLNEGEVVYASEDKESAQAYADSKSFEASGDVLDDWDIDDPTDEDIMEASFQAGYDGGCYEVERVNISDLSDDDTIEISDGSEIDVSDILEKMQIDE